MVDESAGECHGPRTNTCQSSHASGVRRMLVQELIPELRTAPATGSGDVINRTEGHHRVATDPGPDAAAPPDRRRCQFNRVLPGDPPAHQGEKGLKSTKVVSKRQLFLTSNEV